MSTQKMKFLTSQEQKALVQFKNKLSLACGVDGWRLILFGSRARQEGDEDSDLDLLVLLSPYSEEKKIQVWDAAYQVFSDTDISLSPLVLSTEQFERLRQKERLIAKEVDRDGIPL